MGTIFDPALEYYPTSILAQLMHDYPWRSFLLGHQGFDSKVDTPQNWNGNVCEHRCRRGARGICLTLLPITGDSVRLDP